MVDKRRDLEVKVQCNENPLSVVNIDGGCGNDDGVGCSMFRVDGGGDGTMYARCSHTANTKQFVTSMRQSN